MIQLPPINKATDSTSTTCDSKLAYHRGNEKTRTQQSKCCNACSSAGCNQTQMCSCHATVVPYYQNSYLLAASAPRLMYSNMPIFQVPFYAQSTCNVVGCKDCGFEKPNIDDYLRYNHVKF